jgi:PAS domain S-box-containing protein
MENNKVYKSFPEIEAASLPAEKYYALAELSSDFTFVLSKGGNGRYVIEWLSEGFTAVTGYTPLNLPDAAAIVSAKSQAAVKDALEQLNPGEISNLEFAIQTKTAETCWLHVRMRCELAPDNQRKQILGAARDITEQKQIQLEGENLNHKLQILNDIKQLLLAANSLTETLQSVLCLLKLLIPYTNGDIIEYDWLTEELHIIASTHKHHSPLIYENRLPLSFVDYPRSPSWHEVIYIPDLAKRLNLSPFQQIQRTDGIRSLLIAPLYNHQALLGYINIGSNEPDAFLPSQHTLFLEAAHFIALRMQQSYLKHQQTDHTLQLEALVEQRTADLKELVDRLEESNRIKDEFLAAMSHELRTPLHIILGKADVLQDGVYGSLNPKQLRAAVVIRENGDLLLKLINNLLEISNLDTNQVDLSITQVDIQLLCSQLIIAARRSAQKKHIKIEFEALAQPIKLAADETRLEQILLILLDNALKFTPEGGKVGLDIIVDTVQSVIHFEVWDTGIGIDSDLIDLIFLPFKQLDGRLSREYGGAGLGLPLAHRLTQLHDGALSVVSEIGQGSRFTVSLPLTPSQMEGELFSPPPLGES